MSKNRKGPAKRASSRESVDHGGGGGQRSGDLAFDSTTEAVPGQSSNARSEFTPMTTLQIAWLFDLWRRVGDKRFKELKAEIGIEASGFDIDRIEAGRLIAILRQEVG